jgi:hypothetical protein
MTLALGALLTACGDVHTGSGRGPEWKDRWVSVDVPMYPVAIALTVLLVLAVWLALWTLSRRMKRLKASSAFDVCSQA